ncbi:MAG: hypothetical protein Q4D42_12425 [Eubacteriales bacterium]|nr:hypothetical protein [Eubacteriales bacterium]
MKTVTILLTNDSNLFGRLISGVSKYHYSHASISIDADEEIFYSFNMKGFVIEKPKKRKPKTRQGGSMCIRLQVSEHAYNIIEEEIRQFMEKKEEYTYSRVGVLLCLLHIPHKFQHAYFCSQFVAEVLSRAGAIKLTKKESLYLPGHLIDEIECLFSCKQFVYHVI